MNNDIEPFSMAICISMSIVENLERRMIYVSSVSNLSRRTRLTLDVICLRPRKSLLGLAQFS
jgi:hypothetical protein